MNVTEWMERTVKDMRVTHGMINTPTLELTVVTDDGERPNGAPDHAILTLTDMHSFVIKGVVVLTEDNLSFLADALLTARAHLQDYKED